MWQRSHPSCECIEFFQVGVFGYITGMHYIVLIVSDKNHNLVVFNKLWTGGKYQKMCKPNISPSGTLNLVDP
jgi:hypothetical protein